MKEATISHLHPGWFIMPLLALVLALAPLQAQAYEPYSREELAQMLAPIALYPDALLAQVLMASTYPVEVIEADHWVRMNPHYTGEALDVALLDQDWDPSVKAICHFPSILAQMSARISETTHLGNAFLDQEAEVMAMVQQLRHQAYAQGHLTTTSSQQVIVERETIIIRPADYRVIHVPYYDPWRVYGTWWYPAYPPYSWGPPGGRISYVISYWPGVHFSFSFGTWSYFDWPRRIIHIDVVKRPRFVRHDQWLVKSGPWQHAPGHRHGVARDRSAARKIVEYRPHYRHVRGEDRGYSGNRRPDSDWRDHDRRVTGRDQPRADSGFGRDRPERERFERPRQEREPAGRQHPGRQPNDRQRREQSPVERDRQPGIAVGDEWKPPVHVERERRGKREDASSRVEDRLGERHSGEIGRIGRQVPGDSEIRGDRQGRERLEPPRQEREPAERQRPSQQINERQRPGLQVSERQRQEKPAVERDRPARTAVGDERKPPVQVEGERRGNRDDASTRVEDHRRDRGRGRSGGSGQDGDDRDRNQRER